MGGLGDFAVAAVNTLSLENGAAAAAEKLTARHSVAAPAPAAATAVTDLQLPEKISARVRPIVERLGLTVRNRPLKRRFDHRQYDVTQIANGVVLCTILRLPADRLRAVDHDAINELFMLQYLFGENQIVFVCAEGLQTLVVNYRNVIDPIWFDVSKVRGIFLPWQELSGLETASQEEVDTQVRLLFRLPDDLQGISVADVLTAADIKSIEGVLVGLRERFDTPAARRQLLEDAGLKQAAGTVDLNAPNDTVAHRVVSHLIGQPRFPDGRTPLGNLLRYVATIPDLPPADGQQLTKIAGRRNL
jgi:hypothetical protein